VRKSAPKPIRVFLQDGRNDLNVAWGDWWLANLELASALEYAGYDFAVAWGDGFHSTRHGRAILPDSLRWLWRGYRA
jgi:gluconolactonase